MNLEEIKRLDENIKHTFHNIDERRIFVKHQASYMQSMRTELITAYETIVNHYKKKCKLLEEEIEKLRGANDKINK